MSVKNLSLHHYALVKVMLSVCRKSKSLQIVAIDLLQKVSRVVNYQPPISLAHEITDK